MQEIKLWAVDASEPDRIAATPVTSLGNTETEEGLEDILVSTPDLLTEGVVLVGRQVETRGGPLDLLGIDADGRTMVFELKRGTLTRDAVAQVVDYASDISQMTKDQFARLVEENSGKLGIDEIADFGEWFDENHPGQEGVDPEDVKMVLVGLGADERARRMVDFLAGSGVAIQLLTFHVFEQNGQQLIARQSETREAGTKSGPSSKEQNLRQLREEARKLKVSDLLREVSDHLSEWMPAYQWVGTTSYSYHLTETSDTGRPTQRSYLSLRLNYNKPGSLLLVVYERAIAGTGLPAEELMGEFDGDAWSMRKHKEIVITFDDKRWPTMRGALENLTATVIRGWREQVSAETVEDLE